MVGGLVFFSYSRQDIALAKELATKLKAAGANTWLDDLDIKPGMPWDDSIESALNEAKTVLVLLSKTSIGSRNVKDEYSFALEEEKTVVPVMLEKCKAPLRLRRLQFVDYTENKDIGLQALKKALGLLKVAVPKTKNPTKPVFTENPIKIPPSKYTASLLTGWLQNKNPDSFEKRDYSEYAKLFALGCLVVQQNALGEASYKKSIGQKIYEDGAFFYISKIKGEYFMNYEFKEASASLATALKGSPKTADKTLPNFFTFSTLPSAIDTNKLSSKGPKDLPKPKKKKIRLEEKGAQVIEGPIGGYLNNTTTSSYSHAVVMIDKKEPYVFAVGPALDVVRFLLNKHFGK